MEIILRITLEQILAGNPGMIFYGANTCWWTHDPAHLSLMPPATEEEVRRLAESLRLNSSRTDAPLEEFLGRARAAKAHRLPCDPRGGMLYQTQDVRSFVDAALANATHYGRHGMLAFLAAHHLNSVLSLEDPRPWCEPTWGAYNDALDRLLGRVEVDVGAALSITPATGRVPGTLNRSREQGRRLRQMERRKKS